MQKCTSHTHTHTFSAAFGHANPRAVIFHKPPNRGTETSPCGSVCLCLGLRQINTHARQLNTESHICACVLPQTREREAKRQACARRKRQRKADSSRGCKHVTLGRENGLYSPVNGGEKENVRERGVFFFMIRSRLLNTRIRRNYPRSEAEFPILMRSVAHHPEQESGINLEIHSPRLCGGERRQYVRENRMRETIWGDEETKVCVCVLWGEVRTRGESDGDGASG